MGSSFFEWSQLKNPAYGIQSIFDRCGQKHNAIGGWTKNTPKPDCFFEKRKKSSKTQKLKNIQKYAKISDTLFDQRSLIHREAWFPGGPRIPQNPIFFEKRKKSSKTRKLKNGQRYAKISDTPFDQTSLIHLEAWFPPCFVRQVSNNKKNFFFLRGNFRPLPNKNVQMLDHFFPLLFPKDSESLKILDIRLWEVGQKDR